MSKLIDTIATRYDETVPREIEVPEWGTSVFFRPLTPSERSNIRKGINPKDDEELMISLLVAKALDADGNRLFDDDAKTRATLMGKGDLAVIARIVQDITAGAQAGEAKNS